jgi:tetratricopeptide (TPR) repeat protein
VGLGRLDEAARSVEEFAKHIPTSAAPDNWRAILAAGRDQFDSARSFYQRLYDARSDRGTRRMAAFGLSDFAAAQGKLADARRWHGEARRLGAEEGIKSDSLSGVATAAVIDVWYGGDSAKAVASLDAAASGSVFEALPEIERPYVDFASAYAIAGRPERARAMLARFDASRRTVKRTGDQVIRHYMSGIIATADHRYDDAVREYRAADQRGCLACVLPEIARAYDLSGNADSTIAALDRYLALRPRSVSPSGADALYLAGAHKRLGELYEAKGDRTKAASHYTKFVELWKNADPELQPKVAEVKKRLARLSDTEGKR